MLTLSLPGQTAKRPNNYHSTGGAAGQAARVVSPEVHSDRTVTFRLRGPEAQKVALQFAGGAKPMTRDEGGVWSITVGPLEPEIYTYSFVVDGVRELDMANPVLKNGRALDASVVEIPGTPPRFDEVQDVPHGAIEIRTYRSTPLKRWRKLYVYLPPQYDSEASRKFPVLYLRHGSGDNEANWSEDGRAGVILDNLIARAKAVPMIIVMPNGDTDGSWAGGSGPQGIELLQQELLTDIMPMIEAKYRTIASARGRAITGLSMGGGQAFTMGLRNLDQFAWVGEFSSGLISDNQFDLKQHIPGMLEHPDAVNGKLKLLFMSCGSEDPRYNGQLNLVDTLREHGIRVQWFSTPGAHEWKVWRHSLAEFAQVVFRDQK